jgi:hypothetical protein
MVLYFWLIPVMLLLIIVVAAFYRGIRKSNPGTRQPGKTIVEK